MKQSFLMLAATYDPKKHSIGGWFASEKIDGIRAYWDGGLSRGIPCSQVPWANTDKDHRLLKEQVATGLWSRYGHIIYASDEWLDQLPIFPLDGELFCSFDNKNSWQETSKIVKRHDRSGDWNKIKFFVFDSPSYAVIFGDRNINEINYKKEFDGIGDWIKDHSSGILVREPRVFEYGYAWLQDKVEWSDNVCLHEQIRLPLGEAGAREKMEEQFDEVIKKGGEGLILRANWGFWVPERSKEMLKVKSVNDDEGIVMGYYWGKGKLSGLMGSLILDYKGKKLELSGFTDREREIVGLGIPHDGEQMNTNENWSEIFPIGSKVTFRYRELSDTGIPKEGRFLRLNQ